MMVASYRSRLENTSEDWSSLLASLRELTEWVGEPTMLLMLMLMLMLIRMSTLITIDQDQGEIMQVVIKEGELGSLAPLGGDENTIRAQQVFKSDSML